jgi:two-component system, NarL family, response regulator DevR
MTISPAPPVTVFLVDDHAIVRIGLRALLSEYPGIAVVGEAGTAADAIQDIGRLKPDLVLLDNRLPDRNGVEVCGEIRLTSPSTRVLFLTSFADDAAVQAAVSGGADGYLLKEANTQGLVQAIYTVAAGQSVLDPVVTHQVMTRLRAFTEHAQQNSRPALTPQQQKVLALVAEGKTNKEIGTSLHLSDKTVKNYVRYIFQKLGVTRRSQAATHFVRYTPQQGNDTAVWR